MKWIAGSAALVVSMILAVGLAPTRSVVAVDSLVIGVIGSDGIIIPIGAYDVGGWSNPWPEPTDDPGTQPSQAKMPREWYLYEGGSDPVPIGVEELILTEAHCEKIWGFTTNWAGQQPRPPRLVRTVIGMVLSERIDLVPEDSIPGISEFRRRFGLVGSGLGREGYSESKSLGYFVVGDGLIGVFLQLGYEGATYEIYEVDRESGGRIIRVRGGGC